MYGIFTYIWLIFMVNVGKYTVHGSYGNGYSKLPYFLGYLACQVDCQGLLLLNFAGYRLGVSYATILGVRLGSECQHCDILLVNWIPDIYPRSLT